MERQLKERLIGAAVVTGLAMIFIPPMFSDPPGLTDPESGSTNSTVSADGSPIKTYTIDLRQREQGVDPNATAMPPPELPVPLASQPAAAEAQSQPVQSQPVQSQPAPSQSGQSESQDSIAESKPEPAVQARPERQAEKPPEQAKPTPTPTPKPKPETKPVSEGWAVQVASLDNRAEAEKIVAELKRNGFTAFVMAVDVKGKTMYRVRVGPAESRPAADALLTKVKRLHSQAVVMRHP